MAKYIALGLIVATLTGVVLILRRVMGSMNAKRTKARNLVAHGTKTIAEIVNVRDTETQYAGRIQVEISAKFETPAGAQYTTFMMVCQRQDSPGNWNELEIYYDHKNPSEAIAAKDYFVPPR